MKIIDNKNFILIKYNKFTYFKILFFFIIIIPFFYIIIKYKNIRVCLCVIGKKENLYIKEYVEHYKNLGYNHIFIYDNNNINEERFEDILSNYISKKYISIINYRGYRGRRDSPQSFAYYDCYGKNSKYYDWLSFFDIDEFLELKPSYMKIKNFLNNKKFDKCQNIKINWLMYSDNELLFYENKPVKERFTSPCFNDSANAVIKSTVRGNLKINYWKYMNNPHSSYNNYISCDPSGKIINSKAFYNVPINYDFAILRHYATKTIEEYCIKIKRGRADQRVTLNYKTLIDKFNYFFFKK